MVTCYEITISELIDHSWLDVAFCVMRALMHILKWTEILTESFQANGIAG